MTGFSRKRRKFRLRLIDLGDFLHLDTCHVLQFVFGFDHYDYVVCISIKLFSIFKPLVWFRQPKLDLKIKIV